MFLILKCECAKNILYSQTVCESPIALHVLGYNFLYRLYTHLDEDVGGCSTSHITRACIKCKEKKLTNCNGSYRCNYERVMLACTFET